MRELEPRARVGIREGLRIVALRWGMSDGYVHRMTLEVLGHAKADPNNKGALKLELRLSDINSDNIKITVPEDLKVVS